MLPAIANTTEQRHGCLSLLHSASQQKAAGEHFRKQNTLNPTSSQQALQGRERYPVGAQSCPSTGVVSHVHETCAVSAVILTTPLYFPISGHLGSDIPLEC